MNQKRELRGACLAASKRDALADAAGVGRNKCRPA